MRVAPAGGGAYAQTCDGYTGLTVDAARALARRLVLGGFLLLPWCAPLPPQTVLMRVLRRAAETRRES